MSRTSDYRIRFRRRLREAIRNNRTPSTVKFKLVKKTTSTIWSHLHKGAEETHFKGNGVNYGRSNIHCEQRNDEDLEALAQKVHAGSASDLQAVEPEFRVFARYFSTLHFHCQQRSSRKNVLLIRKAYSKCSRKVSLIMNAQR
ncbi:hypothetical protein Y032_0544g3232 [Ancylostoma ceylanicum]|uniref:Uncharacterized protein n=1 Tax=Ancylostoma ceylanicum TaxID=53326 RepID=A0A016WR21_9BILA|nr:hypothetical protein Y032_0544g3232 [Ancylostoma ceylanicum]